MKNKNILKIAILSFSFLFLQSCDKDDLELEPVIGDVFNGKIESEDKLEYTTNSIYRYYGGGSMYGSGVLVFNDVVSDNVFVSNTNNGYFLTQQGLNWFPDTGFGIWNQAYDAIIMANIVINEENLPKTDRVKSLKGEAKLLRAASYFTLLQYYSSPDTQYEAYGVPLNIGPFDPNLASPRSSVSQVYDQIIKDFTEGINEMNPNYRQGKKTFFSPVVGKFLLSKVYLTRGASGDYDKAISLANEVLAAQTPIAGDKLLAYFSTPDITVSEQQPETLFEVEQTNQYNLGVNTHLGAFYANSGAQRSLLARKWVFDLYDNGDVRKTLFNTAGAPASDDPNRGIWLRKWPRNSSEGNYMMNVKVFRYTEAKYIVMEALAKKGESAAALTLLNEHATERGASAYSGDALTAILLDKQKEFIGEGHRFFDLKRNKLGFDRRTNCLNCSLEPSNKLWVLPIALDERTRNPNMTQHPLWQ